MGTIKRKVRVIRVDPYKQRIIAMMMKTDMPSLRKMLKADSKTEIGEDKFRIGERVFAVMAKMAHEPDHPGFRLRGHGEDTTGDCVIVQRGPAGGGLVDCEIDINLLTRELIWLDKCRPEKTQNRKSFDDNMEEQPADPNADTNPNAGTPETEGKSDEVE